IAKTWLSRIFPPRKWKSKICMPAYKKQISCLSKRLSTRQHAITMQRRQCMAGPIRTAIVKLCSANNTTKRESVFSASTIPRPSLKKSLLLLRSNSRLFLFGDDEKRTGCCRNMFSILLKDISFQYHRMSAAANHTCLCTYFLFISHCEIVDRQRRGYSCK